ncbi:MAG: zf-HC2 domain-containing protein [Pseudonocardia sp.]|nr:zf-HC2 domain-containing protein [Pseudonocardia sp.]
MTPLAEMTRMARCLRTSRVLQSYLDGELDDLPAAARVVEHLEECRRCGLHAATYRAIKQALRSGRHDVDDLALRRLRAFSQALAASEGPQPAG